MRLDMGHVTLRGIVFFSFEEGPRVIHHLLIVDMHLMYLSWSTSVSFVILLSSIRYRSPMVRDDIYVLLVLSKEPRSF